jgi:hypothetical protein
VVCGERVQVEVGVADVVGVGVVSYLPLKK